MKKIFVLFVLAAMCLTSCHKEKYAKVEFSTNSLSSENINHNVIDIDLNTTLYITASIFTNVYPGPFVYWYKYNEEPKIIYADYYGRIQPRQDGEDFHCVETYSFYLSDSVYHSGDHYVLSIRFGLPDDIEGGNFHVFIK